MKKLVQMETFTETLYQTQIFPNSTRSQQKIYFSNRINQGHSPIFTIDKLITIKM